MMNDICNGMIVKISGWFTNLMSTPNYRQLDQTSEENPVSKIDILPPEMVVKFFNLLDTHGLLQCRLVCKNWKNIIVHDSLSQAILRFDRIKVSDLICQYVYHYHQSKTVFDFSLLNKLNLEDYDNLKEKIQTKYGKEHVITIHFPDPNDKNFVEIIQSLQTRQKQRILEIATNFESSIKNVKNKRINYDSDDENSTDCYHSDNNESHNNMLKVIKNMISQMQLSEDEELIQKVNHLKEILKK